jgi:hypothetical protein
MSWRYKPRYDADRGLYHIVEDYDGYGHTGPIVPEDETVEGLIEVLRQMIQDLAR